MSALTLIVDVFEALVLLGAILYLFRHADASERKSPVVFLGFSYAVLFVSNLYWIAHEVLTRESIYTFSAIDISSAGFLLLAGASLAMTLDERGRLDVSALVVSGLFTLVQAFLWILWTGAWFKDGVGSLPMWYLSYYVVRGLKLSGAYSRRGGWWLVIAVGVVAVMQTMAFFAQNSYGPLLDTSSGFVCLIVLIALAVLLGRTWRREGTTPTTVARAFAVVLWCLFAMYLMFEPFYSIFMLLSVVSFAATAAAVVGEVERA